MRHNAASHEPAWPLHPAACLPTHPSQIHGPASGLIFQVERMESAGLPAVTMPQLLTVNLPAGRFPEYRLWHGQAVRGRK